MSGPQCCENPPDMTSTPGGEHVEDLGGLKCYISGSVDSKIAVLLVSDIFGMVFLQSVMWVLQSYCRFNLLSDSC